MPLILQSPGLLNLLNTARAAWELVLRVGLFQVDYDLAQSTELNDLTLADFSGYVGFRVTQHWIAPVIVGPRAVMTAGEIVWTHDGGASQNWIYGYCVVDPGDNLLWAERRAGPPTRLALLGDNYRVVPAFTQRGEFSNP